MAAALSAPALASAGAAVASDPTLERSFRGHKGAVTSVSFAPSLRQLASGAADHVVMVWNFKPQLRAFRFMGHKGVVTSVEFSPTGHLLASASTDNTVRLWEPTVRGKCSILKAHSAPVRSVSWSSDARLLITASDDKTCKVWGSGGARFWCSLVGHTNWVRSAVLSRDTRLAASGSDDKTVKLWDVHTHQCVQTFYEHTQPVRSVRFHPHGSVVASAGADNSIKLYDLRSAQMIQHYAAHDAPVHCIDFHPSGDFLLSASDDAALKIFDLREGHQLYTIHGHKGATLGVSWSAEGDFFASAGADQRVMTWATNFDKVQAEPTLMARRRRVHIQPSSAEKSSREQFDMAESGSVANPDFGATAYQQQQQHQQQYYSQQQHYSQQPYEPRTIHADALPNGYSTTTSIGGGHGSSVAGGAVAQPQPHPDIPVQHDCAYDHEHQRVDGSSHAYHSSDPAHQAEQRAAGSHAHTQQAQAAAAFQQNYPLPANHHAAFVPPSDAPVAPVDADPSAAGPRLFSAAGADLSSVRLPSQLTDALNKIVTQLSVVSATMSRMEERLELHEGRMEALETRAIQRERNEQHQRVLDHQRREIDRQQQQQQQPYQTL